MKTTNRIYGIDLGTTNSCIAVVKDGFPHVLPADGGTGIVPSVVSFDNGTVLVGRKALNRYAAFPEESVKSVKRLMGSSEKTEKNGDGKFEPEDISAEILKYLCREAERIEGETVERVVITVPAYFSEAQRSATIEAGRRAGLTVERIVNEPTAAALFYDNIKTEDTEGENKNFGKSGKSGKSDKSDKYALVYDLGGGTFDVSILKIGEIIEVLASNGDTHLGGDDFDERIVKKLLRQIEEKEGYDLENHLPALVRLRLIAESAKISLTEKASVKILEVGIPTPKSGSQNSQNSQNSRKLASVSMELSREDFEFLTEDLIDRTVDSVEKALDEAHLSAEDIDRVILVGGMTRMPKIEDRISRIFGNAQLPVIDPDLSVAKGAAIQGAIILGENCEQILIDVTPHTLSTGALTIKAFGEEEIKCAPIIPRNMQIPVTRARTFYTIHDNQPAVDITIYQGEGEYPKDNKLIGKKRMNLAKAPYHCPVIVEFSYNLNGMVKIVAEQKGYSRKTELILDSRNPDKFEEQNLEEEISFGDDDDSNRVFTNFVTQRAKKIIEKMPDGKQRDELTAMLKKYETALRDDSDVDDTEDELVDMLDLVGK